jgi:nucleoside-diphosphate-sugar epimerase
MPMIVVGADTEAGEVILERLDATRREVRVFVSDEPKGLALREEGFKVAIGDVSDDSHVEGAATRCFSAVLIAQAASDDRERSFADTPEAVLRGWANAVGNSQVSRVIWVIADEPPPAEVKEVARVNPNDPDLARKVFDLDEASSIS